MVLSIGGLERQETDASFLSRLELYGWAEVPEGLSGRALDNIALLRELFPLDERFENVYPKEQFGGGDLGFIVYARPPKSVGEPEKKVAYGCLGCKKIIVGHPRIEVVDRGLEFYCTNQNLDLSTFSDLPHFYVHQGIPMYKIRVGKNI